MWNGQWEKRGRSREGQIEKMKFCRGVVLTDKSWALWKSPSAHIKAQPASSIQRTNLHSHRLPLFPAPTNTPSPSPGSPWPRSLKTGPPLSLRTPSLCPAGDHSDVPHLAELHVQASRHPPCPHERTGDRDSLWEMTVTHWADQNERVMWLCVCAGRGRLPCGVWGRSWRKLEVCGNLTGDG